MQIQISWLLQKPTDLDLHCLQRQGISTFSKTSVYKCKKNNFLHAEPAPSANLIVLGFNNTSTVVGHFMSCPREREKRDRRDSRVLKVML